MQDIHFKIYSNEEKKLLLKRKYFDTIKTTIDYQNWKKNQRIFKEKKWCFCGKISLSLLYEKIDMYHNNHKKDRKLYMISIGKEQSG